MKYQYVTLAILFATSTAFAETTIINNYGGGGNNNNGNGPSEPPYNQGPPPGPATQSNEPYVPAGVYHTYRRNGNDTIYTTGTKQPFYVTPPGQQTPPIYPEITPQWSPSSGGSNNGNDNVLSAGPRRH
jgi:hypothetical protein